MFYNARYYDPALARFVQADSIVPKANSDTDEVGSDEKAALKPMTVDYHEKNFVEGVNKEHAFTLERGFWFQLSDEVKNDQDTKQQWGPQSAQALNRYSYVLNNPLRYIDPSGHWIEGGNSGVGYTTICSDKQGNDVHCSPGAKEVKDKDKGRLMKVWMDGKVRYMWEYSDDFQDFKYYSDIYAGAVEDAMWWTGGSLTAVMGIVGCLATGGAGCLLGGLGYLVSTLAAFYYMNKASKAKQNATIYFNRMYKKRR